MKFRSSLVSLLVLLSAYGCEGSPTSPTTTPSPAPGNTLTLTFVSADLDVGLAGVVVKMGSLPSRETDSNGQVSFDDVPTGTPYEATRIGYLPRMSVVRSETRIPLVPEETRYYTQEFYRTAVFNPFVPGGRLSYPGQSHVFLRLSPEIANDPEARAVQEQAAALATSAANGRITFLATSEMPAPGAIVYEVGLVPNLPASGSTGSRFSGNIMTGGTVSYRTVSSARLLRITLHEIGHILGLGHPTSQLSLMNPSPRADLIDFLDGDKLVMAIMLRQYPGTMYPQDDRNAQVLANGRSSLVIVEDTAQTTESFAEYVIQFENTSDDILRNLTVQARLDGPLYAKGKVDAMGTVRMSQRDTSVIWSAEGVTELQALAPKVAGAVRMRVARPEVNGDGYGRITVNLIGQDGKPVTAEASIVTIACSDAK